jgi:serine/threonine protein kinase/tetratricopeptide (TPR) repeat protein
MGERDLFIAALQISDPVQRSVWLDRECGADAALRRRIEVLLQALDEAGSLLDNPVVVPPANAGATGPGVPASNAGAEPSAEQPGAVIGPYKLLEAIGEGGMGSVWMAQQTEPVKRLVAVKLIKAGMDSRQVIARFEAERQALALMDHPNIAKVLDAGTVGSRQEAGGSQEERHHSLPTADCPLPTESGRPYFVMDLVKGTSITRYCDEHRLTPRQRLELFVPVCQAVQHAHQKGIIHRDLKPSNVLVALYDGRPVPKVIDFGVAKAAGQTLTDKTLVTGFGAIVGTLEYMSPEQAEINQLDIDTRSDIYSLGVLLYELLAGSPPFTRKESEKVGVLEMLRVIREQEPTKPSAKLSTAEGLPTLAANRGTEPAKLTRLVRGELDWIVMKALEKDRNRRYETANGFALDVQRYLADEPVLACPPSLGYRLRKFVRRNKGLVVGTAVVLLTLVVGMAGTAAGLVQARAARQAEFQRAEGERLAKELAEANFDLAGEAVETFLGTVTFDPEFTRFHRLRKKLLESALPFLRKLTVQKSDDPEVEARRGIAYLRLGHLRRALGENEAALQDAEEMRTIFARLTADSPAEPGHRHHLARSYYLSAVVLNLLGKYPEAEAAHRRALGILEKLVAEFPDVANYRHDLAQSHNRLGSLLRERGKLKAAETAYRRARGIRQQLVDDFPHVPEARRKLAQSLNDLSVALADLGKHDEAKTALDRAVDIQEKLIAEFPEESRYRQDLGTHYHNVGRMLLELENHKAAGAAYRKALDIRQKLANESPAVPECRKELADAHKGLGNFLKHLRDFPGAVAAHREALGIREKLVKDFPAEPDFRQALAESHNDLGDLMYQQQKWGGAEAGFRQAISILTQLVKDFPRVQHYRGDLANNHGLLALVLERCEKRTEAAAEYKRSIDALRHLTRNDPDVLAYAVDLGANQCNLGGLFESEGQSAKALNWYGEAIQTLTPVVKRHAELASARQFLRNSHFNRARVLSRLERFAEAMPDWDHGIELDDSKDRPMFRMWRAWTLAHVEPEKAVAEAEDVVKDDKVPPTVIYFAARVCARCASIVNGADRRERHAATAVAQLQQARARGFFKSRDNVEGLKTDTRFDPVRNREDFKKLLSELKGK